MKPVLPLLTFLFLFAACADTPDTATPETEPVAESADVVGDFAGPLGVQLWSFREMAQTDPLEMLQMVHDMGFTHVETAGLYDMVADSFAQAIQKCRATCHIDARFV